MLRCAFSRYSVLVIALGASFLVAACGHKAVKPDEGPVAAIFDDLPSSDRGNAYGLQTVRFGYDSSSLDSGAQGVLKANAAVLRHNPALHVQIEGYCDQRGGIQYNIALGEKRAKAVQHYLEDLGVAGAQLSTVSFGKEKPLDPAETEEAYAKNRRANFVVTKSPG